MAWKMQKLKVLQCLLGHFHYKLSVGLVEAEIWNFEVAHPGYPSLGVYHPALKQVASSDRAIGTFNTGVKTRTV